MSTPVGGEPPDAVDNPAAVTPAEPIAEPIAEPGAGSDLVRSALADARKMSAGSRAGRGGDQDGARRRRTRAANLRRSAGYTGSGPDVADPQPLRSVMRALFAERGWDKPVTDARVFANWPALVGIEIAEHCTPTALRDGELRLSATSSAWATQLRLMAPQILAGLSRELGAGVVRSLVVSGPAGPSWRHGGRSVPGARGPRDTYG